MPNTPATKLTLWNDLPALVGLTVTVIAGLSYGLQFVGPFRGWLDALRPPAVVAVQEADPVAAAPDPDVTAVPSWDVAVQDVPVAAMAMQDSVTPPDLMPAVQTLGQWLNAMQRRQGKVFTRIHGERQGNLAVLHLVAHENLSLLDAVIQRQLFDGISRQWAIRCLDARAVARKADTRIEVMGPDGSLIGQGSAEVAGGIRMLP